MLVWLWLFILTVLEVGATQLPIASLPVYILLIGMALSKALLVALFFMHLRFERLTFALVVSFPAVLAVFLVFMLLPDVGFG